MRACSRPGIVRTKSCCTSNGRLVEMPFGYTSWVSRPSGSRNIWCAIAVGEAMHLVLDRGAVARPDALDAPGEQRRAVEGGADDRVRRRRRVRDVAVAAAAGDRSAGRGRRTPAAASSLGCAARRVKSMLRPSRRGGVPVLSRPARGASSRSRAASALEGGSPARPPAWCSSPTWMRPARKVPMVSTTARAVKRTPPSVTMPRTRPPSTMRSATSCWKNSRPGWLSSRARMARL